MNSILCLYYQTQYLSPFQQQLYLFMAVDKKFIRECFESQSFNEQQAIEISEQKLTAKKLSSITSDKKIREVKKLEILCCLFQKQSINALTQANWQSLIELTIGQCPSFGDTEFKQLLNIKADKLERVSFFQVNIGPKSCIAIAKANWTNLSQINIGENQIGDKGCKKLSQSQWQNLQLLSLWKTNISKIGCRYLSKANWKQLCTIQIHQNAIGWEGLRYLSDGNWPKIVKLDIRWTKTDDQAALYVFKSSWKIKQFGMFGNFIYNPNNFRSICVKLYPTIKIINL